MLAFNGRSDELGNLLRKLGYSSEQLAVGEALAKNTVLEDYLSGKEYNLNYVLRQFTEQAQSVGISVADYFALVKIYYLATAQGNPARKQRTAINPQRGTLDFSPGIQAHFATLETRIADLSLL
jgi:hypothetical protein